MINKLKKRFFVTNMLIILIALITIFGYIYLSSANDLKEDSISLLENHKLRQSSNRQLPERENTRLNGYSMMKVSVSDENEVISIEGDPFLKEEELQKLILSLDSTSGSNKEFHIRYLVDRTDDVAEYFLLDISYEHEILVSLLKNLLIIGSVALAAFVYINFKLSQMMVKPAVIAWDRQSQFISNASHELKTPLTIVLANVEMLENSHFSEQNDRTRLGYIKQESNRMKSLVEEMLFLAKFDEYIEEDKKEKRNISDIVVESILMFDPIAYENQIELFSNIDEEIYLECFPNQIKQINDIFLDNAIKYSPKGGVINVKLYRTRNQIVYSINNSGAYIEPEELDCIFNRFYKKDKARGKHNHSYGLGLPIARKIADLHNAVISVESTIEMGTTFIVRFNLN